MVNFAGIFAAYHWAKKFRRLHLTLPYAMSIELSSICNLRCPQCPVGLKKIQRSDSFIDTAMAKSLIDGFATKGLVLNLYFQGESMLHPDFFEIARYATSKKLYTILSTNATQIDAASAKKLVESGIQRIILSVDGLTQDTYSSYRNGGDVQQVWDAVAHLSVVRQKIGKLWPEIVVQTLVNRFNENELDAIAAKARQMGADYTVFKTMQLYSQHDEWLPANSQYRRYDKKMLKSEPKDLCFRAFSGVVVTSDGDFVPCCYDKFAAHQFGKWSVLAESSNRATGQLRQICKSEQRYSFLYRLMNGPRMPEICTNCAEGLKKKRGKP